MKKCDAAIIQEPWTYKGEIKGHGKVGEEVIYSKSTLQPRTCILVRKGFRILPLTQHCSRDLIAVKLITLVDRAEADYPRINPFTT
jgi:hypothetical protein